MPWPQPIHVVMGAFVIVSGYTVLAESASPGPGGNFSDGNAGEVVPVEDANVVSVQPRSINDLKERLRLFPCDCDEIGVSGGYKHQESRMGAFTRTETVMNGRWVYKNSRDQYLYFSYSVWSIIGPDFDTHGVKSASTSALCPNDVGSNFQEWDGSEWSGSVAVVCRVSVPTGCDEFTLSGEEATHAAQMGQYTRTDTRTPDGRWVYKKDNDNYLFYWPQYKKWHVGPDYKGANAWIFYQSSSLYPTFHATGAFKWYEQEWVDANVQIASVCRSFVMTGLCSSHWFPFDDVEYAFAGFTAARAPYYRSSSSYVYWDPDCDGGGTPAGWIVGSNAPSTTASWDLDGDGSCITIRGRARFDSYDSSSPPFRLAKWAVNCGGSIATNDIALTVEPIIERPSWTPVHWSAMFVLGAIIWFICRRPLSARDLLGNVVLAENRNRVSFVFKSCIAGVLFAFVVYTVLTGLPSWTTRFCFDMFILGALVFEGIFFFFRCLLNEDGPLGLFQMPARGPLGLFQKMIASGLTFAFFPKLVHGSFLIVSYELAFHRRFIFGWLCMVISVGCLWYLVFCVRGQAYKLHHDVASFFSDDDVKLPPIPPSPVSDRTFADSNFKRAYDSAKEMPFKGVGGMFARLDQLLRAYCTKHRIPYRHGEGEIYFNQLQEEAVQNADELVQGEEGICQAVQRMWTSPLALREREFCFILNEFLREDCTSTICCRKYTFKDDVVADLCRAINQLCVTARGKAIPIHPKDNVCFRGGGFDDRYRDFFVAGREFRQPAYLATSFLLATTSTFIARSKAPSRVLWRIHIDPVRKCRHVNFVTKRVPGLPDEQEYLFAPYSVFTVRSVQWTAGTEEDPHQIDLDAAVDNVGPSEDLPLAPWY